MKVCFLAFVFLLFLPAYLASASVVMLTFSGDGGRLGDVATDSTGMVHAVWLQNGTVFYARKSDSDQSWTEPLRVNALNENATGGLFRGPQLCLGRNGTIHVIWYAQQPNLAPKDSGVRYGRLLKSATKFSDPVNLGQMPSDNYSIASDGNGNVAVFWTTESVFAVTSSNDGESFGQPQRLAGLDPCDCCETAPAFDANGKLSLLYRDKRNNDRNIYYVSDALNSAPRTRLNAENWNINGCPMTGNSLALLSGGGYVAGWEEKGNAFLTLSLQTMGEPKQILLGQGKYPKVLMLSDGTVFTAWRSGSEIHWKTLDSNGQELTSGVDKSSSSYDKFGAAITNKGNVVLTP